MTVPLVIGSGYVALDLVLPQHGRGPAQAWAGGSCSNVLVALASLGWNAQVVARIGQDETAELLLDDLRRCGVGSEHVEQSARRRTPLVMQRTPGTRPGHTSSFPTRCPGCDAPLPVPRPWAVADGVRDVIGEDTPLDCVYVDHATPMAATLARSGRERGAVVMFEPQVIGDRGSHIELLRAAHILKYSHQWGWRVRELREEHARPHLEIETRGANGLRHRRGGSPWIVRPAPHAEKVVDTVGAGDWTTAGIIDGIARGGSRGLDDLQQGALDAIFTRAEAAAVHALGFRGARGCMAAAAPEAGHDPRRWGQDPVIIDDVTVLCRHCSST